MSQIVYKVVDNDCGKLVSMMVRGNALVTYLVGEWVEAPSWLAKKGYYITAFKDPILALKHSKETTGILRNYEVWECEAEGIIEELPPIAHLIMLGQGIFLIKENESWPPGTIMVKRIKLLRRYTP